MIARTRFALAKFRVCGELLCGKRFPLKPERDLLQEVCQSVNYIWE